MDRDVNSYGDNNNPTHEPAFCVDKYLFGNRNILVSGVCQCQTSEAMLGDNSIRRANSSRMTRTRLLRNTEKILVVLICITVASERSVLLVGADSRELKAKPEIDDDLSTDIVVKVNGGTSQEGELAEPTNIPSEKKDEVVSLWPTSLVRAARVGAKLRGKIEESTDVESQETELNDPSADNAVGSAHNPAMLTGCHWGTMGCINGNWNPDEINTSSVENNADTGMASARIDARVLKGRGPSLNLSKQRKDSDHQPPQGFRLAGRVVTSSSDGLSYFLDPAKVNPDVNNFDWMMTIPYKYLECGPTIESITEAFPVTDMVLRHFPHSASMSHWMNLGGGVTIENGLNEKEWEGARYIDTDGNSNGHPKLLVALSPLEITVSGNNEETRVFNPGDVILMEDTLGKGHKLSAAPVIHDKASKKKDARGDDLYVIMVSLPHTVHLPIDDWLEESSFPHESPSSSVQSFKSSHSSKPPTDSSEDDLSDKEEEATRALLGFAPKHLHHKHRKQSKRNSLSSISKSPCPLEYDSAYSSLFVPTQSQYRRLRRSGSRPQGGENRLTNDYETNPHTPWFSTNKRGSIWSRYLPSLRRTMLVGIGLSLTSSFVYCVQLLYPPLLVLWGGATMILGGALMNVLITRWSYRRFVADWLEEWRWRREVKRNKIRREALRKDHEIITGELDESFVSGSVESVKESEPT